MAEKIQVKMNAARVCAAIARIGYRPFAALMDLADNSVAAKATRIQISIKQDTDKTFAQKNNVIEYRVADNGSGMADEQIVNALRLGSNADYPDDSLSKYGMGLKAAGFSLGSRITVVSKQDSAYSTCTYVDRNEITTSYFITRRVDVLADQLDEEFPELADSIQGTVIKITGTQDVTHDSASTTARQLQRRLGVVYYDFLDGGSLDVILRCDGKNDIHIKPLDMLFGKMAKDEFDPDSYDCRSPCRVFQGVFELAPKVAPAELEMVIFPQARMAQHAGFTQEDREQIKNYKISRDNMGFFIYRNGRLIRWGQRIAGVTKDDLGFRARLRIRTVHDDLLHVDVSKQNLMIPDEIMNRLETVVRNPLRQAREAFTLCREWFINDEVEGRSFNEKNVELAEEDPDAPSGEEPRNESKRRRETLVEETKAQEEPSSTEATQIEPSEEFSFERIRYSDRIVGSFVFGAGNHHHDGTFVRINRNHAFYHTVLSRLEHGSPGRQALESMFWALAAAENLTRTNLTEIDEDTISSVIAKLHRLFSHQLESWSLKNQDLFDA